MSVLNFVFDRNHQNEEDFFKRLEHVKQMMTAKKKVLDFSMLNITSGMAEMLKSFFANDNTITDISFYGTKMTFVVWKEIVECLLNHKSSKSLFFGDINFSLEEFNELRKLISQKDIVELNFKRITVLRNRIYSFELCDSLSKNHSLRKIVLAFPFSHNFGNHPLLVENGSITEAGVNSWAMREHLSIITERNKSMHKKAREAAHTILAIQRRYKYQFIFPKDLARMLGFYLLKTKTDIQTWADIL